MHTLLKGLTSVNLQRWFIRLCFALFVLPFSSRANAAPCGASDPFSAQPDIRGLTVALHLKPGASATATGAAVKQDSEGDTLVLRAADALEWSVTVATSEGTTFECSLSFPQLLPKDQSPLPVRPFNGNSLPAAGWLDALANFPNPKFAVQAVGANAKRYGTCGAPLPTDNSLPPTVGSDVRDLELQLVLANGKCVSVMALRRDVRKVVVQQGNLRQELFAAERAARDLFVYRDTPKDEAASCTVVDGKGVSNPTTCTGVLTVPADGSLPEAKIYVTFISFRAVSADQLSCPGLQPASSVEVDMRADASRIVKLCAYRQLGDQAPEPIPVAQAIPSAIGPLEMQSCANKTCALATPLGDRLVLQPQAVKVRVQLSKKGEPQLNLVLDAIEAAQPIVVTAEEKTLYVKGSDFAQALRAAICLGVVAGAGDSGHVSASGLSLEINNEPLKVNNWVALSQDGLQLCPKDVPLTVEKLDAYEAHLNEGQDIVVKHIVNERHVATTVLRSDASLPVHSINVRQEGSGGKVGAKVDSFAATRSPPLLGHWLCLEMLGRVSQGDSIWIDVGRITMLNSYSDHKLGSLTAGSETNLKFRAFGAEGYDGKGVLYCAEFGPPGGGGLQFTAVDGGSTEQNMSLAWDGKSDNCKTSDNTKGAECGQLRPDFIYYAAGLRSLRYSHIDVGAWQMTDDTSRVRISAMLPLGLAGFGYPGVVSVSVEGGAAVPATLSSRSNTAGNDAEKAFVGIGIGAYGSACVKIHVELAPRICAGAMADVGVDLMQKANGGTSPRFAPLAGYFFSVGAGIR